MKNLIFALLISLPGLALALTPEEVANNYRSCQQFLAMSTADQLTVVARTSLPYEQAIAVCKDVTSRSLAENQRIMAEYEAGLRVPAPTGPLSCRTGIQGQTECSHSAIDSNPMRCGTPEPGSLHHCTDYTGAPTPVTCYTNLSGYTSCN